MNIAEILQDYALQEIEKQIILVYNRPWDRGHSYMDEPSLLRIANSFIS